MFLADGTLVEVHGLPLRWQRAYVWLSSLSRYNGEMSPSLRYWSAATRQLQSLVIRGAVLPKLNTDGNPWRAQWGASLTGPQDRQIIQALEAAMPPVCSAFPASDQYEFTKGTLLGNFDTYVLEGDDPLPLNSHEVLHAFLEDGIGPVPIKAGSTPQLAHDFILTNFFIKYIVYVSVAIGRI